MNIMKYVKLVFINLTILFVLLLIVDNAISFFKMGGKTQNNYRAIRLREHNPLFEYYSGDSISFRTDQNGYILPYGGNGNKTIVFVGGSTTECGAVNENLRFPHLVGEKLSNLGYKTINAGVSGNNSMHSLNIILNKIAPQRPNKIVLMHNINDLNTYMHDNYWSVKGHRSNLHYTNSDPMNIVQRIFPRLFSLIKTKIVKQTASAINHDVSRANIEKLLVDYHRNLKQIHAICASFDIELIVMTQPRSFKNLQEDLVQDGIKKLFKSTVDFQKDYTLAFDDMNQLIRDFAETNALKLVDLADSLNEESSLFLDVIHYNANGSKRVATLVANELMRQ
jgi:lysophospholipase L1-like esterase